MTDIDRVQQRAIRISFFSSIAILALKTAAYLMTGSTALLSDALESIINVVASAFAMWSIHVAKTPPDSNHPYGHGTVEYFSALLEGLLIMAAAVGIISAALPRVFVPGVLSQLDSGLLVSAVASALNLVLGLYLVRTGIRTQSLTLVADGRHVLADVFTTGGVLAGLLVVRLTDWFWMDGLIACVVAMHIVWTGYGLMRQAVRGLMHETDPDLIREICALLNANRQPEWISIHRLRAWRAGRFVHVDFHLVLPGHLSLTQSQRFVKELEDLFRRRFDGAAEILIRMDACTSRLCGDCPSRDCPGRECPQAGPGAAPPAWAEKDLCADLHL